MARELSGGTWLDVINTFYPPPANSCLLSTPFIDFLKIPKEIPSIETQFVKMSSYDNDNNNSVSSNTLFSTMPVLRGSIMLTDFRCRAHTDPATRIHMV